MFYTWYRYYSIIQHVLNKVLYQVERSYSFNFGTSWCVVRSCISKSNDNKRGVPLKKSCVFCFGRQHITAVLYYFWNCPALRPSYIHQAVLDTWWNHVIYAAIFLLLVTECCTRMGHQELIILHVWYAICMNSRRGLLAFKPTSNDRVSGKQESAKNVCSTIIWYT